MPGALAALPKLKRLLLVDNNFEEVPLPLLLSKSLCELDLSLNQITRCGRRLGCGMAVPGVISLCPTPPPTPFLSLDARMLQLRTRRMVVLLERNPLRQPSTDENAVKPRIPSLLELCMREMLNSRPWAVATPPQTATASTSKSNSLRPSDALGGRPLTQSSIARPTTADDAALESKARRNWIEQQPLPSRLKHLMTMADHCVGCKRCVGDGI